MKLAKKILIVALWYIQTKSCQWTSLLSGLYHSNSSSW
jgi:hypothetical protein